MFLSLLQGIFLFTIFANMKWIVQGMAILVAVINLAEALPPTPHYHTAHINPAPFRRWPAWFSASDERVRSEAMGIDVA